MIHINEIPLDFEPRRKILPQLWNHPNPITKSEPEMSEFDSAFLCGALKNFRPKKILEVGVAAGASTAIILQALEDLGESYEMHSVDISEKFYCCPSEPSGFITAFAKEKIFGKLRGTHKFYLGKILPQVIDEIGGDIDFVILDTLHVLPGEVLDFIAVLPYLKENAVIVLHDVRNCQSDFQFINQHATAVLFSAVTAEKFLNFQPDDADKSIFLYPNALWAIAHTLFRYPNIGAFKVSEQTAENIDNVFLTLILRWSYFPPEEQIVDYLRHYRRFYPAELFEIFQETVVMNTYNFCFVNRK